MDIRGILDTLQIKYVSPRQANPKYFMACCVNPEHHDKHPSMRIDAEYGNIHCYGCGFRGPIARLLSLYPDVGIDVQDIQFSQALRVSQEDKPYWENKPLPKIDIRGGIHPVQEVPEALEYLRGRGCSDRFIDYFEIQAARLAYINGTTYWNRVCIPVFYKGTLVSVEGRDWTKTQKSKCIYPAKGMNSGLFHYEQLDLSKPVILTEGTMDLVSVFEITDNVTCSFGSELTRLQIELLGRIPHLIAFADPDKAGYKMLAELDKKLPETTRLEVASSPDSRDPGDLDAATAAKCLEEVKPYPAWLIEHEKLFDTVRDWPAGFFSGGVL